MDMVKKHGEDQQKTKDSKAKEIQAQRIANFTTRVLIAQNRYLKGERSFPVDYIKKQQKETDEVFY